MTGTAAAPGNPFQDGPLYHLLQSRLYRGQIAFRGEAIVSETLFDAVQAKLQENRVTRTYGTAARAPALLTGLLFDEHDRRVTPTHANKRGRRYRYYASQSLIGWREKDAKGIRVPAADVDGIVRLSFLAPDIAEAILDGTQPNELTANRLANLKTIPMEWREQRALLGFAARG